MENAMAIPIVRTVCLSLNAAIIEILMPGTGGETEYAGKQYACRAAEQELWDEEQYASDTHTLH